MKYAFKGKNMDNDIETKLKKISACRKQIKILEKTVKDIQFQAIQWIEGTGETSIDFPDIKATIVQTSRTYINNELLAENLGIDIKILEHTISLSKEKKGNSKYIKVTEKKE